MQLVEWEKNWLSGTNRGMCLLLISLVEKLNKSTESQNSSFVSRHTFHTYPECEHK